MGVLLAIMCFCLGLLCEMDQAEKNSMVERDATTAVVVVEAPETAPEVTPEPVYTVHTLEVTKVTTPETTPEPVYTVRTLEVTKVTYTEAVKVEKEPGFVYRLDVPLEAELQEAVWDACQEHNVEYELVLGLIEVESTFRTDAVSCVGCYGLMQLNPQYFPTDLSPADNVRYGVTYLAEKLDQYAGDVGAALTAYNAGHDTGNREYAEKVVAAAERWS